MTVWTVFILMALGATIYSLIGGISSMVVDGEVAHADAETWMWRRIGFQAATAALVLFALAMG